MSSVETAKPQDQQVTKKPYESPKLLVYGDICAITRDLNQQGADDSGFGTKT